MKQEDNLLKQLKGLKHRVGRKEREELEERVKEASTEGERRATYILKEETIEKVKEVAKERGQTIKSLVQTALENHLKSLGHE